MLSITVDPALTFNLIRVLAALTCIAVSGFLLVYFAFGLRSLTAAVATALPIGLAATLLVANLFAYVIGTPRALTWGLLAVLAVAITIALARRHYYKPLQPLSRRDGGLFFGAALLLFILSAVNYAVYPVWDYYLHFWLANTIRFGNFPVMAPGAPMLVAEYHYGGAFIAAILSHIGQLDSAISFFILTPFAAMTAYLTASVLAARILKNIRFGLLAGLFFSFGAGLTFLIAPVRNIQLRWFAPTSAAAEEILVDSLASITPTGFAAFPLYLTQPHYLIAWAVLLSVIILATHFTSPARHMEAPFIRRIQWIMLGVLFASVALIESSVFALGLIGWGAFALWWTVTKRKFSYIGSYVLAATPAALIAVFQGGFLTAVLLHSPAGGTGLGTAFDFTFLPLPSRFGPPHLQSAFPPSWATIYLVMFGLPLLAAPALLIWALRSKHSIPLVWLAAIGSVGMLFPHFVVYHYSSTLLRWIDFGHSSLALLLGIGALTLLSHMRRRWLAWSLFIACAALTIGWPLAASMKNVAAERHVTLGQSTEDHWTVSPSHRQSDHIDWITGREYMFLMGAEARRFLRTLPPDARVLTNHFPEVPLLIRGLAPHKNVDVFSFTYFRYPSPTYFDALYALDPTAMQQYGITHIVVNQKWFIHTSPQTHAILQDYRFFSLIFSDEDLHEGFAWHHVYEVLPEYYAERPRTSQDLVRSLKQLVPQAASVYVSPGIPQDLRWALLYALRESQIASAVSADNHINVRLAVNEPQPTDRYDFALLSDDPPGERWLNWAFIPQDFPAAWGIHPSQRIWHALGVGLYALDRRDCPNRAIASAPSAWHIPAHTASTLDLTCLQAEGTEVQSSESLLLTILSPNASRVEIIASGLTSTYDLEPGATLIPLAAASPQRITLTATDLIWVRAQRVPPSSDVPRTGIPALHIVPTFSDDRLGVDVRFYGKRTNPLENQVVWDLTKQRRIYGHWWHWDSPFRVGVWRLMQSQPPDHGSYFSFLLDFTTLESSLSVNGRPAHAPREVYLPENPGEPYVLYFTLFRPAARVQSLPVAWITYAPGQDPTVLLAPRFILLDQAPLQE